MAWRKSPPELMAAFDVELPDDFRVERRKMFGYPAAFVNGNLFAGLHQEDVVVRLSEGERKALEKSGGRPWEPTAGRVMREYMLLPDGAGANKRMLVKWLTRSFLFAAALPPRMAKKRAKVSRIVGVAKKGRGRGDGTKR